MDSSSTVELLGVTDTCSFLDMLFFTTKMFWGGPGGGGGGGGGGISLIFVSYIIYRLNVQAMGGV